MELSDWLVIKCIVGPANQNGCVILCVGNLADEKFQAFNEVSRMKFLGTVVHRLTELLPNHCQHRGNLYHYYIFKYYFSALNEEIKKLRKHP
jgi:hypothetical protein